MNIFVVEDFDPFRRFICSKLQSMAEFHITQASDGFGAVQKAEELQPDLILLDFGLPNLDGIEISRRIRKVGMRKAWDARDRVANADVVLLKEAQQRFVGEQDRGALRKVAEWSRRR